MAELLGIYLNAFAVVAVIAVTGWLVSVLIGDVSIVDTLWSLFFAACALVYYLSADVSGTRALLVLTMAAVWAVRLSAYVAVRNRGEGEDRRYRQIRKNNEPHFELKSLYLVFGLQGLLAWVISIPLLWAIAAGGEPGALDALGALFWIVGMVFEAVGDLQLYRFRSKPGNAGAVMDRGLWRYTRHPNYFGNACIWWGFFFFAAAAGGWWTIYAPALMTFLLTKVSGVALLERDIADRRPGYADYVQTTNAFFPGPPRKAGAVPERA